MKRKLLLLGVGYDSVNRLVLALVNLSSAIYNQEASEDSLNEAKSAARAALTTFREEDKNLSISSKVIGLSKSLVDLSNFLNPPSENSTANPKSSDTKNISKDDVPQESGDVNQTNQKISECGQDEAAYSYMTVKETKLYGHRIYTLELDTIEKLGGNLDDHFNEMFNPAPSGAILQEPKEKVNTFLKIPRACALGQKSDTGQGGFGRGEKVAGQKSDTTMPAWH